MSRVSSVPLEDRSVPAAGLDDDEYRRVRKRQRREAERFNDRLAKGFAILNGEGVYGDDEDGDDE